MDVPTVPVTFVSDRQGEPRRRQRRIRRREREEEKGAELLPIPEGEPRSEEHHVDVVA
ncbi:MAG: hypothetical protein V1918_05920 [Planctomycetota bacterium]